MTNRPLIAGVGMVPFTKPGKSPGYVAMGEAAVRAALRDAGLEYRSVQQAYAGYVYGDSTCGQSVLYGVGLSGIPITNVNNNCASGSTALFLARQAVECGAVDCALAVGFEQMNAGAIGLIFRDREITLGRHYEATVRAQGWLEDVPPAAQQFGGAGQEYAARYGTRLETFAQVAVKARRHAKNNPNAVFREEVTVEEVLASKPMFGPLTKLQCCPPTCGAAAAVIVSPALARKHQIKGVEVAAQGMASDTPETFEGNSMMCLMGQSMSRRAADLAYEAAGIGPDAVDVVELHDCFTAAEIMTYETLGLTGEGEAERFIWDGDNTYGGRVVVNPSGGLLSKGHPLGATGLAQCAELVWQLRGQAGARQVHDARIALQHNAGLGGAAVVTLYRRPETSRRRPSKQPSAQ